MNVQYMISCIPVLLLVAGEPRGAPLIGLLLLIVWAAIRKPRAATTRSRARYNPLDPIDVNSLTFFDDCRALANLQRFTSAWHTI